jgi:hypothetical protein
MSMKSKPHGRSTLPGDEPLGKSVEITDEFLTVTLRDGRVISTPIEWYPRLRRAKRAGRAVWEWDGDGVGIHWPLLDEDLSIAGMLRGNPSPEYRRQRAVRAPTAHAGA